MTRIDRRSISDARAERDHLLSSIEDLDREHGAGDVDEADYATLRASYVARAAQTLRELESLERDHVDEGKLIRSPRPGRRIRRMLGRRGVRRGLAITGVASTVAGLAILASALAGVRLPGGFSSGTVSLPNATQLRNELTDAQVFASSGHLVEAISLYDTILHQAPNNAQALAYRGWLERLSGIAGRSTTTVRTGDEDIAAALHANPHYADARAFEVIVVLQDDGGTAEASSAFAAFMRTKPSTALLDAIAPQMALAFRTAHLAVPALLRPFSSES